ncbi:AAA family ATPase [Dactylosporangium sp. CA-092794]|uniref:AAA family ATPase n=1 Tax=Dactylosporangium sp. CA-092794 TaxID=3239929 RepID=UPI003D8CAA5D
MSGLTDVLERIEALEDVPSGRRHLAQPDLRDGSVYVCPPKLRLALRVALVTGRPLLLLGYPGSGKSSIAAYVARNLGWRYYELVVTARTEARDLLWRFDMVHRLADAQVRKGAELNDIDYVEPGPLWWAIDPASARVRGWRRGPEPATRAEDPFPTVNPDRDEQGAVVLIDELDKADPDVPSGLLVPLGSLRFTVTETGAEVAVPDSGEQGPRRLVIVTSNEERDLPTAFVRRCIVLRLELPGVDGLVEIASRHLRSEGRVPTEEQQARIRQIAERVAAARPASPSPDDHVPSVAEFLDAVRAMLDLGHLLSAGDWAVVEELTVTKSLHEGY